MEIYMEEVKAAERKTQKGRRISYMNRERIKRCMKHCLPWKLRYFIKLQEAKGNIRLPDGLKQKRSCREYNDAFYKALEVLKQESTNAVLFHLRSYKVVMIWKTSLY